MARGAAWLGGPLDELGPGDQLKRALRGLGVRSRVCTPEKLQELFGIECQNLARPALAAP